MTTSTDNGVNVQALLDARTALVDAPEGAQFTWRASNEWVRGTHSQSAINGFFGLGAEQNHRSSWSFDADHPAVLVGTDEGPTPVEFLLHALAACLTSGIANIAAARGVTLTQVSSTVEGDIDLLGILGMSGSVRNGYRQIRVSFVLRGDDPEKLRAVVEQSRQRSAVFDVLTNGAPVSIDVDAA